MAKRGRPKGSKKSKKEKEEDKGMPKTVVVVASRDGRYLACAKDVNDLGVRGDETFGEYRLVRKGTASFVFEDVNVD